MQQSRAYVLPPFLRRSPQRVALLFAVSLLWTSGATRAVTPQMENLDLRIEGAERIVVARVRDVAPEWRENEYGDQLIVSRVELEVGETLKGDGAQTVWMDMEGGALDGLTLRVSHLPELQHGERAVFFLAPVSRGVYGPLHGGDGILPLDEDDVVRGTTWRLDDIRGRARGLGR